MEAVMCTCHRGTWEEAVSTLGTEGGPQLQTSLTVVGSSWLVG